MKWIDVKEKTPESEDDYHSFVCLNHSLHGVGMGSIFKLDKWMIEDLEKEYGDKYICSFIFIKAKLDGNYCFEIIGSLDSYDSEDVFEHSPHFKNLGTITHWMPTPKPPTKNEA